MWELSGGWCLISASEGLAGRGREERHGHAVPPPAGVRSRPGQHQQALRLAPLQPVTNIQPVLQLIVLLTDKTPAVRKPYFYYNMDLSIYLIKAMEGVWCFLVVKLWKGVAGETAAAGLVLHQFQTLLLLACSVTSRECRQLWCRCSGLSARPCLSLVAS